MRFDYAFIDTPKYSTVFYQVLWVSKGTCNRPSSFHKISQESSNSYIAEITGNWNSYLCDAWRNKLNIRSYTLPLLNNVPNLSANIFILLKYYSYLFETLNSRDFFFYEIYSLNSWKRLWSLIELINSFVRLGNSLILKLNRCTFIINWYEIIRRSRNKLDLKKQKIVIKRKGKERNKISFKFIK